MNVSMKNTRQLLAMGALSVLTASIGVSAQAAAIHHWSFDTDGTDSVGSNDATFAGSAAVSATTKFGAGSLNSPT